MGVRLAELEPSLKRTIEDGVLLFLCPACLKTTEHYLQLHISAQPYHERDPREGESPSKNGKVKVWQATGVFPDTLTLQPSVNVIDGSTGQTSCWHGFIQEGEIR